MASDRSRAEREAAEFASRYGKTDELRDFLRSAWLVGFEKGRDVQRRVERRKRISGGKRG